MHPNLIATNFLLREMPLQRSGSTWYLDKLCLGNELKQGKPNTFLDFNFIGHRMMPETYHRLDVSTIQLLADFFGTFALP